MCNRRSCSSVFGIVAALLAAILLWPPTADAQDGWTWQNPLPQGRSLNGIWGSGATNVFAVGDEGTVVQYDGAAWRTVLSGVNTPLRDVWGSNDTSVFAVGDQGAIVHYDGTSWSTMASGVIESLGDIWGSSASDVFVVGGSGAILHYNGANWTSMTGNSSEYLAGVWGSSGSDVYTVGRSGAVLHYDGTTWSQIPTDLSAVIGSITDVWSTSEGTFAVTDEYGNGPVLRYTGAGWSAVGTVGFPAYSIWGSSATVLFVVGAFGAITHYNGSDWIGMGTGLSSLNGVWGTSGSNVYAVGYAGMILHYDGASWTNISSVTNKGLRDIWGCGGGDVFAVGEDATILHYNGTSWSAMSSGASGFLAGVWGSSCADVFAVGASKGSPGGLILHYDGSNWSAMGSGIQYPLNAVWGDSANDVFAVGYAAAIVHYDGVTWRMMRTGAPGTESISSIWGSSGSDVYAVGASWDYGTLLHYDGRSWSTITGKGVLHYDGVKWDGVSIPTDWPYYDFTAVWGTGSDDVFVAGSAYGWTSTPPANLQKLWHYDGERWSAMPYPDSAPAAGWANSAFDVFAVGGTSILHYPASSTLALLQVAKAGSGSGTVTSDPGGIACGATCGAVFPAGTAVTLTASADRGMLFEGWRGACSGIGPCAVTMNAARAVTATFDVEDSIMPQGSMMYYGGQLAVREDSAASAASATTQLVVFAGAPPPGLRLVWVEGSEPHQPRA